MCLCWTGRNALNRHIVQWNYPFQRISQDMAIYLGISSIVYTLYPFHWCMYVETEEMSWKALWSINLFCHIRLWYELTSVFAPAPKWPGYTRLFRGKPKNRHLLILFSFFIPRSARASFSKVWPYIMKLFELSELKLKRF